MQYDTKIQEPRAVPDGPWHPSPYWAFHCQLCGQQISEYYNCRAAWPPLFGLCAQCISKPHPEHRCCPLMESDSANSSLTREAA